MTSSSQSRAAWTAAGGTRAIFDCDGTLVDSEWISTELLARSLSGQALPTTTTTDARHDYRACC